VTSNLFGVYHNPAVMANLAGTTVGFMHHENIFDSRREFVGMSSPLLGGAFSLRLDYFKIGSIESRELSTEEAAWDLRRARFAGLRFIGLAADGASAVGEREVLRREDRVGIGRRSPR